MAMDKKKLGIEDFLSVPEQMHGVFLREGKIAILDDRSGMNQIWEVDTKSEPPTLKQRTHSEEPIWQLYAAADRNGVFYTSDVGGDENEQVYYLGAEATEAVRLTHTEARCLFGGATPDLKRIRLASNARSAANFDIVQINTETQEVDLVIQNDDHYNWPCAISANGRYMLTNKLRAISDNPLYLVDYEMRTQRPLVKDGPDGAYQHPVFTADGKTVYFVTDAYGEFLNVYRIGIEEGAEPEAVYRIENDVDELALSRDDRYLAMLVNLAGAAEIRILDLQTGRLLNTPQLPAGDVWHLDFAPDGLQLLFSFSSGSRPWGLWIMDLEEDSLRYLRLNENPLSEVDLVEPVLRSYESFDGLRVPYWLYLPLGRTSPCPVIVDIHGGPEAQATPMFDGILQYFLHEGFAVVTPNVRGSTGFGKTYHHLDDVEKRLDSVRDIEALADHLLAEGIAEEGRLAVMGGSYGGYMTLSALVHSPQHWACGCDIVGMSDLETFLENTSDYRRAHRASEYGTLEEDRETLRRVSPIHQIDRIRAPLMVIHGANDPRVPVSEAEQIVARLREQGNEVLYLRYENEGHGLARHENEVDAYTQLVAFFRQAMGTA